VVLSTETKQEELQNLKPETKNNAKNRRIRQLRNKNEAMLGLASSDAFITK
jgi:hypothetical protein